MFKILVVEDDKDLNKTVCSFLDYSGYQATGCLNASQFGQNMSTENKRLMIALTGALMVGIVEVLIM